MGKNSDIFEKVIKTDKTRENIRKVIPVLVKWAEEGRFNMTYRDLNEVLGHDRYSGIGYMLGVLDEVRVELEKRTGTEIPSLNSLCKNQKTMLPSDGLKVVFKGYESWDDDHKRSFAAWNDYKVHKYQKWHWVLDELGLKPIDDFTEKEKATIRKSGYGFGGGEGEEHKVLKEYILNHPESLGIKDVVKKEDEHDLPSGDRLDVYFEKNNGDVVAIEVKPKSCPEKEINRGIFQCVKYKAVLEAMRKVDYESYDIDVMLVTDNTFSELNVKLAKNLNVKYIDKFKH